MASLQQESTGVFHIVIRHDGKRFKRSLKTKSISKAKSKCEEITETVNLIKRGKLSIPKDTDPIDFILNDGKVLPKKTPSSKNKPLEKAQKNNQSLHLNSLFDRFFAAIPAGNIEDNTLQMMHTHKRHLLRIFGSGFDVLKLTGERLQEYINKRAKEKTHFYIDRDEKNPTRKNVSATTIRKELITFGAAWRWGMSVPLFTNSFPNQGLRFPKTDEKAPFQTWSEIERQIETGNLNACQADSLWECLYLRKEEITAVLDHVKKVARHPFIYPMFAMAAFTGARRSELLRSEKHDFDFDGNFVTIREKKRIRGQRSTRRVPLTNNFREIMLDWFQSAHSKSNATFVKQRVKNTLPISVNQARSNFQETLHNSHWSKIKGWHCLRHSFISNLACAGVDQRIIDDFVGHTTEDMRRRYRHLFPDVKQSAIDGVFG